MRCSFLCRSHQELSGRVMLLLHVQTKANPLCPGSFQPCPQPRAQTGCAKGAGAAKQPSKGMADTAIAQNMTKSPCKLTFPPQKAQSWQLSFQRMRETERGKSCW